MKASRDKKYADVTARMREVAKSYKLKFGFSSKDMIPATMWIDGDQIVSARPGTFPSREAYAISFAHEIGHHIVWLGFNAFKPRDKFDEEIMAWSMGLNCYFEKFRCLKLRSFSRNFPLRRFVMSRLMTYAGMFKVQFEGFENGKGVARQYRILENGSIESKSIICEKKGDGHV